MPTDHFDIVEFSWRGLGNMERGYWMLRFAEALEKHEDHQGENAIPHPLAGPPKITEVGHQVITLAMAAEGGDRFKQTELEAYCKQADMQIMATVNWVVVRSVLENKPAIRANLLLEDKKEKKVVRNTLPVVSAAPPTNVKVKRSDDHSGTVYVSVTCVLYASMYYVQICQDNPTDEASWMDAAQSDSCRKIEVKGLKPGEVYHFRVRCFGGGRYSAWSQFVTVRIL